MRSATPLASAALGSFLTTWVTFLPCFLYIFLGAPHLERLRGNGNDAWVGWPTAPRLEELRQQWLDAPDVATQKKLCEEIQKQALIDVPYIPLGQFFLPTAYRRTLKGVIDSPIPFFWNVEKG